MGILDSINPFDHPGPPAFQPNLPRAQTAFVNKYNQLSPYLSNIPEPVRNSLINFDMGRVSRGQTPLPLKDSVLAIQAATSRQAQTLAPTPSAKSVWGNSVRDISQLASGIFHMPQAIASEVKRVVEHGPEDVAKAVSSGNPVEVVHQLAQTPGIRMIPGSYVVGGLTGGRKGIEELATHPVFTALDVLPFAQKAAAGTALFKAQEAERAALLDKGSFAPELRPIRTVLTRALDEEGKVVPNIVGRAGAAVSHAPGLRVLDQTFSQASRYAARLEGQANEEYRQLISPQGLHTTDPVVQATRDARTIEERYNITPEESTALKRRAELGQLDDPAAPLTDNQRAFLHDTDIINRKFRDYTTDEQLLGQFGDEFYDRPTATRLNSAKSKLSSAQGVVTNDVLPRLRRTFDNYGDERVSSLITALEEGRTADANRIANGLYRGKTRLDKPQAVLSPRSVKVGDIAPADATLAAIGNVRGSIRKLLKSEERLTRQLATNTPARFMPLVGQRAAEAYGSQLARAEQVSEGAAKEGIALAPMDTAKATEYANAILDRDYASIPGYSQKEHLDTIQDIGRTWQDMRDVEGLNPMYFHRVKPGTYDAAVHKGVYDNIPSISQVKERVADLSPTVNNIGVAMSHQGMELLQRRVTEQHIRDFTRAFGKDKNVIEAELRPMAQQLAKSDTRLDTKAHLDRLVSRDYGAPSQSVMDWAKANDLDLESKLFPKTIMDNLERSVKPVNNSLFRLLDPITNTFRTAVLPLSPRWQVYNILGGGVMTTAVSGPSAFKYISEARQLLADMKLAVDDPAALARVEERIPREFRLGLGSQVAEASEMNFRAGNTMARLWEHIGETSPVAQRFRAAAEKVGGAIGKVSDRSFEFNQLFDDMYRTMAYLNEHDKGVKRGLSDSVAQKAAIETARKVIHQWDEYTPIERQVLRQVLPFYGFTQHIMRFAFKYPFDHPIRADLLGSIARNELEDQGTGLPAAFMNALFFGHMDSKGHQKAISISGLNPFRDVANNLTLAGFVGGMNPVFSTILEQLGIRNGQAELYPNLRYDPNTGQLTATHDNPLINFLSNTIPQSQILTSLIGVSNEFKGLMAADPAAAKRALISSSGIPVLVRDYDLPKEYIKAEAKRQDAQAQARTDAYKSGNYGYASQFPGLSGLANQVAALQGKGNLAPYIAGNEAQTNPAYAAQVKQLTGK